MGGPGLATAPFWHCFQSISITQPSFLPLDATHARNEAPGATQPHHTASWLHGARSSSSPSATHLCSALLLHLPFSFAPPVLRCFSCRPCFLLPLDHTSYSTFALSLLLTALSIMHFHKIPPSSFNFYFSSCLLQTALDFIDSKEREKKVPTNSPDRQVSLPPHLWALPFLKCKDLCVEHLWSPPGLSKEGHTVGLVVVDTPVPRLANNLYSYTRLDSHLPLQSPRAATHGWDPGSKLEATGSAKVRGASEV